jgi:hypothetical protein
MPTSPNLTDLFDRFSFAFPHKDSPSPSYNAVYEQPEYRGAEPFHHSTGSAPQYYAPGAKLSPPPPTHQQLVTVTTGKKHTLNMFQETL